MAETTKTVAKAKTEEDTRLDKKVKVISIAPWVTGSTRKTTNGDVSIPPKGTVLLTREEIIAQAQNGNKLLTGTDGVGSHATWYIDDAFTRQELSFEDGTHKQQFLTQDAIKELFDLKMQKTFETNVQKAVVTRAEKAYLINTIATLNLNDYKKIAFCEKHAGLKVENATK